MFSICPLSVVFRPFYVVTPYCPSANRSGLGCWRTKLQLLL